MKRTVLIYIEHDHKYLLIHKHKRDMNYNKYMGVGGKIEIGESPYEAAIRETFEETGLVIQPIFKGNIYFHSKDYKEHMILYKALEFKGKLKNSEEGKLTWVEKDKLRQLPMWEGDYYFLEKLDQEEPFQMHLFYDKDKLIHVSEIETILNN